jgi:copper chaperone CopZ
MDRPASEVTPATDAVTLAWDRLPIFFAMRTTLEISGMRSVHAVRAIFTALSGVAGITRADVSLGRAVIEHDARATIEAMRDTIAIAGFEVMSATTDARSLPTL